MPQSLPRTRDNLDFLPAAGEMARCARARDWSLTGLGAPGDWPAGLRTAAALCLTWAAPAWLAWGPQRALIYNDACIPLLGALHPRALGEAVAESGLTAVPAMAAALERAWRGEAVSLAQAFAAGDERGAERTYAAALTPLRDEDGEVAGVLAALTDVTAPARAARTEAVRRAGTEATLREASRRLAAVLESVSDVFVALDRDWRIAGINDRALALAGRQRDEVLGRDFWETFPGCRGGALEAALRRALDAGEPLRQEHFGHLSKRWFEVSVYPSDDGLAVFGRDIDERKRAEDGLRASEERFARFMEHLPGLAWVKDPSGRFLYVNQALVRTWGVPREALLGRTLAGVLAADSEARCRESDAAAARAPEGVQRIESYTTAAGERRHLLVSKFPIPQGTEGEMLLGGIAVDITERKQANEALRDSEARLAAEVRMMERLHGLSARLMRAPDLRIGLEEVLEAALAVADARLGNVQLLDARTGTLEIVAQRGFGPEFLDHFRRVGLGDGSACANALESGRQTLIEDTETDPGFAPHRAVAARAGFRAVQSTPIVSHDERLLGVLSTHFPEPRRPSPSVLRVLELCARLAGEFIERVRMEQALRASEALFRQVADCAPVMIWLAEPDGRASFLSQSWYGFTGQTPETGLGRGWIDAIHPDDVHAALAAFELASSRQEVFCMEYRFRRRDGVYRWMIDTAVPRFAPDGRFLGFVGSVLDIAERREAEERLREADRRKDEFLAILAHELRNPLAPLRNGLEIMRLAGENREVLAQARDMMERQLSHLVRLVDDLLDLARITRGRIELRRARVDLAVVVRHALETSRPLIEQGGHELSVHLPSEPLMIEADTIRLAQAIANLLNNAARYTDRGGHIRLSAERRDASAVVSVQDNGVGIPPALLPHVFDVFSRVERPLGKAHGGLGIGLSIVKHLIEMHGGAVEAASEGDGRGSEFRIRLPLAPHPRGLRAGAADGEGATPGPAARRVLVADDNPDAAASLAALLELLGSDVRVARDGREAVEIAAWFRPELALLDIGMPGLDGCGACRRIRALPGGARMTLVALTGWGQEQDRRRSLAAGFDQHLVKPVEPAVLERLLAALAS